MPDDALHHETVLYPTLDAYLSTVLGFVRAGLDAGEPVLVAVPAGRLKLITDALGEGATQVDFVDLTDQASNPGRLIPVVLRSFLDRHGPRRTRVVCEALWPDRQPDEVPPAVRQEAMINRVFADYPTTILCPYDAEHLNAWVLALANRTHPIVVDGDTRLPCGGFAEPEQVLAAFNEWVPDHSPATVELAYDDTTLPLVQDLVADYGARVGLSPDRVADLVAALGEVAGTALPAEGDGTIRVIDQPDRLICEVRTPGRLDDPLAGLRPPAQETPRGRGLYAANMRCDLVETHTHADSTTTRLLLWR